MHTASGACLICAPGAVSFSNMVLEHIQLRIFLKIIYGPGPYGLNDPEPYGPRP